MNKVHTTQRYTLYDEADLFRNERPKDDQATKCTCGWIGTIKECKEERFRSSPESWDQLAGRDGWIYKCPKCGMIVTSYFFAMS